MVILFLITFCSIMMIISCQAAYACTGRVRNHTFLGARLPDEAAEHPDVKELEAIFRRRRRFALVSSLILHIPVFPLIFWYISIWFLYYVFWCFWLFCWYIHAFNESFRDLYQLKRRHGWFTGESLALIDPSSRPPKKFRGRKGNAVLYSGTETYLADEDRFWLNGYYENPDDPHILAPSRLNSPNISFNMGCAGVRRFEAGIWVLLGILLIWLESIFLPMDFTPFTMTVEGNQTAVHAPGYSYEFLMSDVQSIELLEELPTEDYSKNSGADTNQYLLGKFRLKTIGQCRMYYYFGYSPILRINLPDTTVFFNSRTEGYVEELYQKLTADITP